MTNSFNHSAGWIHAKDGPARKRRFFVQRAPLYVRFVQDLNGKWDILDLLEDKPADEEEIFVYRQDEWMHVRAAIRGESGYHYNYVHVPIAGELKIALRFAERWHDWVALQVATQPTDPSAISNPSEG